MVPDLTRQSLAHSLYPRHSVQTFTETHHEHLSSCQWNNTRGHPGLAHWHSLALTGTQVQLASASERREPHPRASPSQTASDSTRRHPLTGMHHSRPLGFALHNTGTDLPLPHHD
eukprot:1673212-Rhodomonas_salina.2